MTAPTREPLSDFLRPESVRAMAHALASVAEQLDQRYPNWIAGERWLGAAGGPELRTVDPCSPGQSVSRFPKAGAEELATALQFGARRVATASSAGARDVLRRAAAALRKRRCEFAAWLCFEGGIEWVEADEEVAAAVDFLHAHAQGLLPADRVSWPAGDTPWVLPPDAGVGLVAGDAALPLAGPVAALATHLAAGRAAILVPEPSVATIGWKLVELLLDAGAGELIQFVSVDSLDGLDRSDRLAGRWGTDGDVPCCRRPPSRRAPVVVLPGAWSDGHAAAIVRSAFARGGRRPFAPGTIRVAPVEADRVEHALLCAAEGLVRGPAIDAVTERAACHPAPVVRGGGAEPTAHELVVRGDGAGEVAGAWLLTSGGQATRKARTPNGALGQPNQVRASLSVKR